MVSQNHYELLGLSPRATQSDIKRAFRRLAHRYHPDKNPNNPDAEKMFKELAAAYQILSDDQLRRQYDAGIDLSGTVDPNAEGFSSVARGLYNDLFGSRKYRRSQLSGRNRTSTLRLSLEEALSGVQKTLQLVRSELCVDCVGTGADDPAHVERCGRCHGTGERLSRNGFVSVSRVCAECRGRGLLARANCPTCNGEGTISIPESVTIDIPKGCRPQAKFRMTGFGEPSLDGGTPGDLLLVVQLDPHPIFRFKGRYDLERDLVVPEEILKDGGRIDVETPHGTICVTIPSNSTTDGALRVSGKGFFYPDQQSRGDLYLKLKPFA